MLKSPGNVGVLTDDCNDDRDIHGTCHRAQIRVGDRRVQHKAHRTLRLGVLGQPHGAHPFGRAAAHAAEHRHIGGFDDGLADRLLRREGINGKDRVRVTVSDDGKVCGKNERLEPAPVYHDPTGLINGLRHFQNMVTETALNRRRACFYNRLTFFTCKLFQLFSRLPLRSVRRQGIPSEDQIESALRAHGVLCHRQNCEHRERSFLGCLSQQKRCDGLGAYDQLIISFADEAGEFLHADFDQPADAFFLRFLFFA